MKSRLIVFTAIAAAGLSLASCDSAEKLAKNVTGTWTGSVERIDDDALSSDIFSTYTFNFDAEDKAAPGGDVVINATLSSSYTGAVTVGEVQENVTMTVAGTSTVKGTWKAVDDDEIVIRLNPSSVEINLDPDSRSIIVNQEGTAAVSDTLRPVVERMIKDRLAYDLRVKYSQPIYMDDVKVMDGRTIKYEINDIDYVLTAE